MTNSKLQFNNKIDEKIYWEEHIRRKNQSGLSRVDYCRKYNLKIHQLEYHERKQRRLSNKNNKVCNLSKLIPVKIEVANEMVSNLPVCTIMLKSGHELRVNDINILATILAILG